MSLVLRILTLIVSVAVHGMAFGGLYLFSHNSKPPEEVVYHVALAEFAPVEEVLPPLPEPEPETEPPPEPEPEVKEPPPPPKPEVKKISPKKVEKKPEPAPKPKEAPKPKPKPKPKAQTTPVATAPAIMPRQIGGLAAYESEQVDQRPSIVKRVPPVYPRRASRMNIEGQVVVQLVVDKDGNAKECKVISAKPAGYFEESALKAASKMRFIPGKLQGKTVNTLVHIPFAFGLR